MEKNDSSAYIETDIRDGNALVFGYELGGYINMYCTDGINIQYSGGHKLQEISLAAQQLFNFLKSDDVFIAHHDNFLCCICQTWEPFFIMTLFLSVFLMIAN